VAVGSTPGYPVHTVYQILSIFATGDGNSDGETNIADLTPLVSYGYYGRSVSDGDLGPAAVDYDRNGEVNIADVTALGQHLGERTTAVEVLLGDSDVFSVCDMPFATLDWQAGAWTAPSGAIDSWDEVFRVWGGEVTLNEVLTADYNADGTVYISARASDGTACGDAFMGLDLDYHP
jgi:hypothetical protein